MPTGGNIPPHGKIRGFESGGSLHPVLQRAKNGDPEALEVFLTEARRVVLSVVRRRLRGGWTGDHIPDVMQDALVDILRSYEECEATSEGGVRAWIQAIARREVTELFRRGPGEGCEIDPEWAEPADTPPSPRIARALVSLEQAAASLEGLSHRLLWARFLVGMTWHEVGVELGLPSSAAKRRWQRLQVTLRRACVPPE